MVKAASEGLTQHRSDQFTQVCGRTGTLKFLFFPASSSVSDSLKVCVVTLSCSSFSFFFSFCLQVWQRTTAVNTFAFRCVRSTHQAVHKRFCFLLVQMVVDDLMMLVSMDTIQHDLLNLFTIYISRAVKMRWEPWHNIKIHRTRCIPPPITSLHYVCVN